MKKVLVSLLFLFSCQDTDAMARRAADSQLTEARLVDKSYISWECGHEKSETEVAYTFTGKSPTGKQVTAVVCCGMSFKACTLRYK